MANNVTIRTVATEAGVSVTTVSHVLNQITGTRVSQATRLRVEQTAARLGYLPSKLARGLRMHRTETLALLSDKIATSPHAGRIILGAQEAASAHGLVLLLLTTGNDPQVERREIQTVLQHQVDGVLYATMYHRHVQVPAQLDTLPVVLLDAESDDLSIPSVVPDEVEAAYSAVRELAAHGHRQIGFLTCSNDVPATRGRLNGYRAGLAEVDMPFHPDWVVADIPDAHGGYRAAIELLRRPDRPTALFCFNDQMAMGAYRASAELGLRIPADLSIVGFDDHELIADGLYPGLTTMALPHYEMGAWALNTMLELISEPAAARRREPSRQVLMRCSLVRRDSVAAPAGA